MSTVDTPIYQLASAARVGNASSGILIPLFTCYPRNEYFVGPTDLTMQIGQFQELDILLDNIVPIDVSACSKTQFVEGDFTPVIVSLSHKPVIWHEEDLTTLLSVIEDSDYADEELIKELIADLRIHVGVDKQISFERDMLWDEFDDNDDVDPRPAKLWLDRAVQQLDERLGGYAGSEEAKSRVRIQLLSWATKIADEATTPVFKHFIWAARRAEEKGVYIEDILGAAILNWICRDVGRLDRVIDIIREFRRAYGRGPLTSVLELRGHKVATLADWADRSLSRYYSYIREIMGTMLPYQFLGITFVADDGTHWPADIRKKLAKRARDCDRELRTLLQSRNDISVDLEVGSKERQDPAERAAQYRDLRSYERRIIALAAILDSLMKSLSDTNEYRDYSRRFARIDYNSLGLSQEFFAGLERSSGTMG